MRIVGTPATNNVVVERVSETAGVESAASAAPAATAAPAGATAAPELQSAARTSVGCAGGWQTSVRLWQARYSGR